MKSAINRETLIEAINASLERILNQEIDEVMQSGHGIDDTVKKIEGLIEWHEKCVEILRNYFETHPEKEETE